MSYDLGLKDPKTNDWYVLTEPHHMRGGTYAIGGSPTAEINITYNYGEIIRRVFGHAYVELSDFERIFGGGDTGIRHLYGKTGAETIPILTTAIEQLGDDIDDDYWKATEGNVKVALNQCLALARMCPDGVWYGD